MIMKGVGRALCLAFSSILDFAAPPRARTERLRGYRAEDLTVVPRSHTLLRSRITTILNYDDTQTADLVQSLKYDGSGRAAQLLASALAEYFAEEFADEALFNARPPLLVPVPLHAARKRERGFNQIEMVLNNLPREFTDGTRSTLVRDALIRVRSTRQQTRLPRQERLSNVAGAFACTDPEALCGARVYVIDDVATTGATLVNAATPLIRAGSNVTILALARANRN